MRPADNTLADGAVRAPSTRMHLVMSIFSMGWRPATVGVGCIVPGDGVPYATAEVPIEATGGGGMSVGEFLER